MAEIKSMSEQRRSDQVILFLGQGLGLGRIPFAPGTVGTLPGLLLVWVFWQGEDEIYPVSYTHLTLPTIYSV